MPEMSTEQSEIRRRVESAGASLRIGDLSGAIRTLAPGSTPEGIEEAAREQALRLSQRVQEVQRRTLGSVPIDPSGARGLAQTMSVYLRALQEMRHPAEDAGMLATLLVDLQYGNLSRQILPPTRDRLLAALIHVIVELAPSGGPSPSAPETSA